jgi:N-acetylneuraminic acid mutarotase
MNQTSFPVSSAVHPLATRVVRVAALVLSVASLILTAAPAMAAFQLTGSMGTARVDAVATLLPNGKVLLAGGFNGVASRYEATAELYDPATGSWSTTGSMTTARSKATATLLPNGKVLVAGGYSASTTINTSAELYDPATGTWSTTGSMTDPRAEATATLLPNGKVLMAGGSLRTSAELYDPATGTWSTTGSLATGRDQAVAALLPNGKVLVAGGFDGMSNSAVKSAELYDPASGSWSTTGSLAIGRNHATATLLTSGKVLVVGGRGAGKTAEFYDPATGSWSATGNFFSGERYDATATLLPNGKVLVAGGQANTVVEVYDPASGTWSANGTMAEPCTNGGCSRGRATATLLPNGKVLVAGGFNGIMGPSVYLASAEVFDPAIGSWSGTGSLATPRQEATATLLPNGKVLVAGGHDTTFGGSRSAEVYDPATGLWSGTGSLVEARYDATATLLPNGKVLVAGGYGDNTHRATAELYDPASGSWQATGSMATPHRFATATLLPDGKVLVAGGETPGFVSGGTAELYDPATGQWSPTASLTTARHWATATLLPNGKVLVAGGYSGYSPGNNGTVASAELYDPASGTWSATGNLATSRSNATATLLPSGKVLVAAGHNDNTFYLATAELYDPAGNSGAGSWTATGSLATARIHMTTTLLPNGKVLVASGDTYGATPPTAELYDPIGNNGAGSWSATGSLAAGRSQATATLLPSGKVLVAGGGNGSYPAAAELYDVGLGFNSAWQPQIATASSPLALGTKLILTGSGFQGISQASSGSYQDSATNYPVVQLRRLDSEQVKYLPVDPATGWSDTGFTSTALSGFLRGPALVTVFTNGIPSTALYLSINSATPTMTTQASSATIIGGTISDTATIAAGYNPSGTVTFSIYGPNDATCGGAAVFTSTKTVSGNGNYTSDPFTPTTAGTYRFTASYSGDINNTPVAGACNAPNGSVLVSKATPTVTTQASAATVLGGNIFDNATIAAGYNPTGTITFSIYGPDDTVCGSAPAFTSQVTVNGNKSYGSGNFVPTLPGTYRFVAMYSGDALNSTIGNVCGEANESVVVSPAPSPTPTPKPASQPLNISTRMEVLSGNNVLIAGIIVTGPAGSAKTVAIRSLGPSLANFGIANSLSDPLLELHKEDGAVITNDNWQDAGNSSEIPVSLRPSDPKESVILASLPIGSSGVTSFTAIVRGANGETGVAVAEAYDLDQDHSSRFANVSTRGFINTGNNVMIAGFILGGSDQAGTILVRAIGPSLTNFGITNALGNPILELHDGNGATIKTNDDWKTDDATGGSQEAAIQATTLQPSNDLESAIVATLPPGAYTAVVAGKNNSTGVGLVEVYNLK